MGTRLSITPIMPSVHGCGALRTYLFRQGLFFQSDSYHLAKCTTMRYLLLNNLSNNNSVNIEYLAICSRQRSLLSTYKQYFLKSACDKLDFHFLILVAMGNFPVRNFCSTPTPCPHRYLALNFLVTKNTLLPTMISTFQYEYLRHIIELSLSTSTLARAYIQN